MSKYLDKAHELRAIVEPHHNCAQSVLMSFSGEIGITDKQAYDIAVNFGAGMKCASVCGAITGALMAMGLLGVNDPACVKELFDVFKKNHCNCIDCADLLKISKEKSEDKKTHCDNLVYECVSIVEKFLNK